jgi:hypothetical protein
MFERLKQSVVESYVGAIALGWLLAQSLVHFARHFHCTGCRLDPATRISRIHRTYNSAARLLAPRCSARVN